MTAFDRLVDALADNGLRVRHTGGSAQAQCPAHEDRNPSLSVRPIEGSVLLHCHSGCSVDDVLASLNLTRRDLYDEPRGNELARYQYTDASGRPTRTVHRLDGKRFTQSGDKALPQLYRLPRVLEAVRDGRPVYLVEGEKDVHAVEAAGAVGTTAPQGAANFHLVDVSPLKGSTVVAVVDRDAAGKKWAEAVRERLDGYAEHLRFVEAADGKDAADHIAAGNALTDLRPVDVEEPWGTPVPIDAIDRTPLPIGAGRYPRSLWAFVDAVAEALQVPRDMVFLLVLSILSTASGGRWRARIAPDWSEVLALMTVGVMESGERKSATVKTVASPLYTVEDRLMAEMGPKIAEQQALRDLRAADLERLKRAAGKNPVNEADYIAAVQALDEIEVPTMPRLLADDITPERLGGLMAEQGGRMGVSSAEGGLFAILAGRYSSGQPNLDLVLKAHAGDPCRVDRTSRPPLMLNEPFLAIGVTIQPDILEGLAETRLFRGAGLLARFLYAMPVSLMGRRKLDPDPIPEAVAFEYRCRVEALADLAWHADTTRELPLSADAMRLLWQFRLDHEPRLDPHHGDLSEVADWASKLPGHLVRIAALFTLFEDPRATAVPRDAMAEAIDLASYLTSHAVAAFDTVNGRHAQANRPRAVLAWIRRRQITRLTLREAQRALGGQQWARDADAVRETLLDLEDFGWLRRVQQPAKRGRPSEIYDVNPAAHVRRRTHERTDANDRTPREAPAEAPSVICVNPTEGPQSDSAPGAAATWPGGDNCPHCGWELTSYAHQTNCQGAAA